MSKPSTGPSTFNSCSTWSTEEEEEHAEKGRGKVVHLLLQLGIAIDHFLFFSEEAL
jgi:hypothetical protein